MVPRGREKLTTYVTSETLIALHRLAKSEGRELGALVDEALSNLIAKHQHKKPRASVVAVYQASHEAFSPLYKKLAD